MVARKLFSREKIVIEEVLNPQNLSNMPDNVYVKKVRTDNRKITVYIAEDYYLRIGSTLTVTVIADETPEMTTVEIISSGGKGGRFMLSWGAEKSAVNRIVEILVENGFKEL